MSKYIYNDAADDNDDIIIMIIIIIMIMILITVMITMIIVRGALFFLCRGTNIHNSFWGASEFQDTYHGFVYYLTFYIFLSGFLYCWCERNTGRHFIGFY